LPPAAIAAAKVSIHMSSRRTDPPQSLMRSQAADVAPDVFYCLALLDATGIATTPGSGFGQKVSNPDINKYQSNVS